MRSLSCLQLAVLATIALSASCKPRAPGSGSLATAPLSGSNWEGKMIFRGVDYAFRLRFDEVRDGQLSGEIVWDYHGMRSPVRGKADGNHLVFVDDDGDTKDVVIDGLYMLGTDKGGAAKFVANRVEVRDQPATQQQQQQQPMQGQQQQQQQQQ